MLGRETFIFMDFKECYNAMGNWPGPLCTTDPETNVSREISDEEIQKGNAHAGGDLEDADRRWLIRKFRTNQVLSSLIRGANQLGYSRQAFNPTTYLDRGQDTKETSSPEPCNGLPVHRSSGMCPRAEHERNISYPSRILDRSRHSGSGQVCREDKQTQD